MVGRGAGRAGCVSGGTGRAVAGTRARRGDAPGRRGTGTEGDARATGGERHHGGGPARQTAELELTQLQIAQLQEELEHYFTLYTQQKNQARQLGISSGVDEHKMLKVENASSLHLITRILSSTTA